MPSAEPPAPPKPLLERVGVQYFQRRSQRLAGPVSTDAVHVINADERTAMRRVERGAVLRSAAAGALSGFASAIAEVWATPLVPDGAPFFSAQSLEFWLIVGGVTLVASILEILFIYWDTLRSVHELARVAGLRLFGSTEPETQAELAEALARAALELPNPVDGPYGINSRRDSSRAMLVIASLVYKAKIGLTSFVFKLVLRRVLSRVVVRGVVNTLLPFVAVPVTAVWNGLITWWVLKEARIRAMGPSALDELVEQVFAQAGALSDAGRLAALRAVASSIVRTQDLHPNLVALLSRVAGRVGDVRGAELDDVGEFLRSLKALTAAELSLTLQLLAIACIVDGRFSARERTLFTDALSAAGRPVALDRVEALRRAFVHGDGVAVEAVRAVA